MTDIGVLLTPDIVVWIHPINTKEHPTYRPGYRWAVHAGGQPPSDLRFCCNAGRADTEREACLVGESHGVAACKAARILGVNARYTVRKIGWDPIPASADLVEIPAWKEGHQS